MGLFVSFCFYFCFGLSCALRPLVFIYSLVMLQNISIKGILAPLCMLKKYLEGECVRVYEGRN